MHAIVRDKSTDNVSGEVSLQFSASSQPQVGSQLASEHPGEAFFLKDQHFTRVG